MATYWPVVVCRRSRVVVFVFVFLRVGDSLRTWRGLVSVSARGTRVGFTWFGTPRPLFEHVIHLSTIPTVNYGCCTTVFRENGFERDGRTLELLKKKKKIFQTFLHLRIFIEQKSNRKTRTFLWIIICYLISKRYHVYFYI